MKRALPQIADSDGMATVDGQHLGLWQGVRTFQSCCTLTAVDPWQGAGPQSSEDGVVVKVGFVVALAIVVACGGVFVGVVVLIVVVFAAFVFAGFVVAYDCMHCFVWRCCCWLRAGRGNKHAVV